MIWTYKKKDILNLQTQGSTLGKKSTVVPVMRCPLSEGQFTVKQQNLFLKNAILIFQMTEFGVPSSQGPL
jgi:hypothetical protein